MKKREYGNTGLMVTEIGFGSAQLSDSGAWPQMSKKEGIELVQKAYDFGCNFFDTAPNYADGRSEEILGEALKHIRDCVVINTKCGLNPGGSADRIRQDIERSLKKLQTDYIDSVLIYNFPAGIKGDYLQVYEVLENFINQGKIRYYGVSVETSDEMYEAMKNENCRVIEIRFNILYQEPEKAILKCREKGIAVVVQSPLDSGWLTGKYNKDSTFDDNRRRWSHAIIEKRYEYLEKIKLLKPEYLDMVHFAIQFILSYDEISTVIPGVKNMDHLIQNVSAGNNRLEEDIILKLKELWNKDFNKNILPW